eukprot:Opistho-1_new@21380
MGVSGDAWFARIHSLRSHMERSHRSSMRPRAVSHNRLFDHTLSSAAVAHVIDRNSHCPYSTANERLIRSPIPADVIPPAAPIPTTSSCCEGRRRPSTTKHSSCAASETPGGSPSPGRVGAPPSESVESESRRRRSARIRSRACARMAGQCIPPNRTSRMELITTISLTPCVFGLRHTRISRDESIIARRRLGSRPSLYTVTTMPRWSISTQTSGEASAITSGDSLSIDASDKVLSVADERRDAAALSGAHSSALGSDGRSGTIPRRLSRTSWKSFSVAARSPVYTSTSSNWRSIHAVTENGSGSCSFEGTFWSAGFDASPDVVANR